jgi:hypothetical protein
MAELLPSLPGRNTFDDADSGGFRSRTRCTTGYIPTALRADLATPHLSDCAYDLTHHAFPQLDN